MEVIIYYYLIQLNILGFQEQESILKVKDIYLLNMEINF
jgi:hypothetical protein